MSDGQQKTPDERLARLEKSHRAEQRHARKDRMRNRLDRLRNYRVRRVVRRMLWAGLGASSIFAVKEFVTWLTQ